MKIENLTPEHTILTEFGRRLSQVRKQQGYTQASLADLSAIGVATLRRIEDGKDSQLSSWIKILKALGMSNAIDALLPESFSSPMSDVLNKNKRAKSKQAGIVWGDEKQ